MRDDRTTERTLPKRLGYATIAAALLVITAITSCVAETSDTPPERDPIGEVVQAASGGGTLRYADTVTDLRGLTGGNASWTAILRGYNSVGDGGGGVFIWDTTATVDDGGTFFNSNGFHGAAKTGWRRIYSDALNVRWFGAKGIGGAFDDTTPINNAIAAATASPSGAGTVLFPSGVYRVTSTIHIQTAVRLIGVGAGPGGNTAPGNNDERGAIIEHDFNTINASDLFSVEGVLNTGATHSVGTTFENLLLRQVSGNGTGNANGATAIKVAPNPSCTGLTQCDASKPSWVRIRNVTIEQAANRDDWYFGIWLDGSATSGPSCGSGLRDIWIENVRIASNTHANASIYANTVANLFITNTLLNSTQGRLLIDGPGSTITCPIPPPPPAGSQQQLISSGVKLLDVIAAEVNIGYAQQVEAYGGIWNSLITTLNTKLSSLWPAYLSNSPTWNAVTSSLVVGTLADNSGRLTLWNGNGLEVRAGAVKQSVSDFTGSGVQTPDAGRSNTFVYNVTGATATLCAPTAPTGGQSLTVMIHNVSGGALTTSWDPGSCGGGGGHYKLAGSWTDPANGKWRSITFIHYGGNWIEVSRNAADAG